MLSYARTRVSSGWTYGLHEAMDQIGAVLGPVIVAGVLHLRRNDYQLAFGVLLLPALVSLTLILIGRFLYPNPANLEVKRLDVNSKGLTKEYWFYMIAVGLIALGFADYPLIAYHFLNKNLFSQALIPVLYAVAMAISALVFGYLYDQYPLKVSKHFYRW